MHLTFDNKLQEVSGDHVILKLTDPVQHMNFTAINDNLYHNTHHRIVVLAMEALFMITLLHGITIIETKHPDSVRRVDGNYKHKRNQLQQTHKRIQKPFKNELFHTVDGFKGIQLYTAHQQRAAYSVLNSTDINKEQR
eukprot:618181_1